MWKSSNCCWWKWCLVSNEWWFISPKITRINFIFYTICLPNSLFIPSCILTKHLVFPLRTNLQTETVWSSDDFSTIQLLPIRIDSLRVKLDPDVLRAQEKQLRLRDDARASFRYNSINFNIIGSKPHQLRDRGRALHDYSDILLELSRTMYYLSCKRTATYLFLTFAITFIVTRCFVYLKYLVFPFWNGKLDGYLS